MYVKEWATVATPGNAPALTGNRPGPEAAVVAVVVQLELPANNHRQGEEAAKRNRVTV